MKDINNKTVLITGAGSGIGRATAYLLSELNCQLILVDIDEKSVERTSFFIEKMGGRATCYVCDISQEKEVIFVADSIQKKFRSIDILINNAGIASGGRFLDTELTTWKKVLDVNVMGVINGCHYFIPLMMHGKGGHVVNLSSMAGFWAGADLPVYATSKFAVLGFTESLRADMAEYDIGVSAICPGIVNTNIVKSAAIEGRLSGDSRAGDKLQRFYQKRNYTPEKVGAAILEAITRNIAVRPVSPESWAVYYAKRFVPNIVGLISKRRVRKSGRLPKVRLKPDVNYEDINYENEAV